MNKIMTDTIHKSYDYVGAYTYIGAKYLWQ